MKTREKSTIDSVHLGYFRQNKEREEDVFIESLSKYRRIFVPDLSKRELKQIQKIKNSQKIFKGYQMSDEEIYRSGLVPYIHKFDVNSVIRVRSEFLKVIVHNARYGTMEESMTKGYRFPEFIACPFNIAMIRHEIIVIMELMDIDYRSYFTHRKLWQKGIFDQLIDGVTYLSIFTNPKNKVLHAPLTKEEIEVLITNLKEIRQNFIVSNTDDTIEKAIRFVTSIQEKEINTYNGSILLALDTWFNAIVVLANCQNSSFYDQNAVMKLCGSVQRHALDLRERCKNDHRRRDSMRRFFVFPVFKDMSFYINPFIWIDAYKQMIGRPSDHAPYVVIDIDGCVWKLW